MPIIMEGKVKEVTTYDGEYGQTLQVKVYTNLDKTGPDDWSDLLEVPATEENKKTYVPGAMIKIPVRAWAKRKKDGGAWLKYTAASAA